MRILFPFLLTKNIHRFLLLIGTHSFLLSLRRGYIRKVSVYLVQFFFYLIAVLIAYLSANDKNRNEMTTISKQYSNKTETSQCYPTKYRQEWATNQQRHRYKTLILIVKRQLSMRQQQTTVQKLYTGSDKITTPVVTGHWQDTNKTPLKHATI